MKTFNDLQRFAQTAQDYRRLRAEHPRVAAGKVLAFLKDDDSMACNLDQYLCHHKWSYTGSAYGGDEASYHGEGRCYCVNCGMDGDA